MSEKVLYLECFSGISGDMSVAALLDLGADQEVLLAGLKSLEVDGYEIKIGRTKKCGIDACDFQVILESESSCCHSHAEHCVHHHSHEHPHNHQHSHNHEHPHSHEHSHDHDHPHDHKHPHDHEHSHDHSHGEHCHRNLADIENIIKGSKITEKAKEIAKRIFEYVAIAEAKAHGLPISEVHFHEVGAVDSIVDIVAVAICIDNLGIDKVVSSKIYEGQGFVKCQHGIIPVPVPAVINIVKEANLAIRITETQGEMITPTGAAIVAGLQTQSKLPSDYKIVKIGLGAGKKDFPHANILRAMILEVEDTETVWHAEETKISNADTSVLDGDIWMLETNIDDSTGEALSFTMERLLEIGANDVYFTPIYMKKNRPATKLSVICKKTLLEMCEDIIFKNLSTIGVRKYSVERTILERKIIEKDTQYGTCQFKVCTYQGETYQYPEYEYVKKISMEKGISFGEAYHLMKMI